MLLLEPFACTQYPSVCKAVTALSRFHLLTTLWSPGMSIVGFHVLGLEHCTSHP